MSFTITETRHLFGMDNLKNDGSVCDDCNNTGIVVLDNHNVAVPCPCCALGSQKNVPLPDEAQKRYREERVSAPLRIDFWGNDVDAADHSADHVFTWNRGHSLRHRRCAYCFERVVRMDFAAHIEGHAASGDVARVRGLAKGGLQRLVRGAS